MAELKYFNPSSNYNRMFSSEIYITQMITNIKNRLGRQMLNSEKMYLIQLLKSINPVVFDRKSPKEISTLIENKVIDEISTQTCAVEDTINIHEMLKAEIGVNTESADSGEIVPDTEVVVKQVTSNFSNQTDIASILGAKSLKELVTVLNPEIVNKTAYMFLDSRYRILDDDGTASFRWNFVNNATYTQGTVNVIGDIKDITSIKVFPTKIPYVSQADNNYTRVTMFIEEFSAQAFIGQENRKFHFVFAPEIQDRYIDLNPKDNNAGLFKFKNPITHVETITVSFGSPLQPIVFDLDRQTMVIESYGTVTRLTCAYAHNLLTGDLVYISNFKTNNTTSAIDTIISSAINKSSGIIITYVTDYIFSIDVDSSMLLYTGAGTVAANTGEQNVIGTGTNFATLFSYNDIIVINGFVNGVPVSSPYIVGQIISDTQLVLQEFYMEDNNVNLTYQRNNTINNLQMQVYFGSKRVFIPIEIHYNESVTTN